VTDSATLALVSDMIGFNIEAQQRANDETIEWLVSEYRQRSSEDRDNYIKVAKYTFGEDSVIFTAFLVLIRGCN